MVKPNCQLCSFCPPKTFSLQLEDQLINRIGVAALVNQLVTELKQSTDHQAMFCGGQGENPFRCFHIDPSYVYLLRLYIEGTFSANVQIADPVSSLSTGITTDTFAGILSTNSQPLTRLGIFVVSRRGLNYKVFCFWP